MLVQIQWNILFRIIQLYRVKEKATILYILRHGQTDWNSIGKLQGREDIDLNEFGRIQALQIAEYFAKESFDVIVSSPLKRAYETAQIIALKTGIPDIHIFEDLTERCWGSASGLLPEERHSKFPNGVIPDQEEFEAMRMRGMNALVKIVQEFEGKKIIIVSHGGIINSMLYSFSQGDFGSFKTRLANACINKIIISDSIWNVEFYNKSIIELL